MGEELLSCTVLQNLAGVEEQDSVCGLTEELQLVGHDDDGEAQAPKVLDDAQHFGHQLPIKACRGLVQ